MYTYSLTRTYLGNKSDPCEWCLILKLYLMILVPHYFGDNDKDTSTLFYTKSRIPVESGYFDDDIPLS